MGGGIILRLICILEKDIKKLIAYTSVAHMRFIIILMLSKRTIGRLRAIIFIVAHGISSSGLFIGSYIIYNYNHRRSLLLNLGILNYIPSFCAYWFLINIINIGAPPTMNFFSEILALLRIVSSIIYIVFILSLILFLRVGYRMIIYRFSQYGQANKVIETSLNESRNLIIFFHIWLGFNTILLLV